MAARVAIWTDFERGLGLFALLVPSGPIKAITIAPGRHLLVEFGTKGVGEGNPSYLVFDGDMEILAVDGTVVADFLGTRQRAQLLETVAAPFELAVDVM